MKLKVLFDSRGNHYLATESGEILAEFGKDDEFEAIKLYVDADGTQKAEIALDLIVGSPATIVDADEKAVRALPAPEKVIDFDCGCYDDGPYFYGGDEEEEDDEDIMEGLCICCAQELCLQCDRCHTPACEEETEPTDDCGT